MFGNIHLFFLVWIDQLHEWESWIDTAFSKQKEAEEIIEAISKMDDKAVKATSMPEDLVYIIETLETNRLEFEDRQSIEETEEYNEEKAVEHFSNGEFSEALCAYQSLFNDMFEESTKDDQDRYLETFIKNFTNYSACLFHFNMYQESLEFLLEGLRRIKSYPDDDGSLALIHGKVLLYIAKAYCCIGDYKKLIPYVEERNQGLSGNIIDYTCLEAGAFVFMNSCLSRMSSITLESEEIFLEGIHNYFDFMRTELDPKSSRMLEGLDHDFDQKFIRMFVDLSLHRIFITHQTLTSDKIIDIPQAFIAWTRLKSVLEVGLHYLDFYKDNSFNHKFNVIIVFVITICQNEINLLWKKMELIFSEEENQREIWRECQYRAKEKTYYAKIHLNEAKTELEKLQMSHLNKLTYPATDYYKKVLIVLKEINLIPFIHNYWKVFWKNHPAKKEKSEHKKWRLLKNSASVMLSVKSKFNLEQK